ncbi:MAG: T9SS type A sorting domain-containing protein, partial [Sphingobacteriales bacterium]
TVGTYGTIIDDISVSTGSAGVLPIRFISFNGKMATTSAVLNWTASNDDNSGKAFVIERSGANNKFDSIGSVNAVNNRGSYSFTDAKASNGTNYYRIKAVNSNGIISYTNVIALSSAAVATTKLYPNPAVSNVAVSIPVAANMVATVQIFNLAGNLVASKQVTLTEGSNVISLDVTSLKPGSFVLKISNNEVSFAQSFCKR